MVLYTWSLTLSKSNWKIKIMGLSIVANSHSQLNQDSYIVDLPMDHILDSAADTWRLTLLEVVDFFVNRPRYIYID